MKHELAISILEEKLNLAKKCRDLNLIQFAQTMFRDKDLIQLEEAIEILKKDIQFNFSGSELIKSTLKRFRDVYGVRVLKNIYASNKQIKNAKEVIIKIRSAERCLGIHNYKE